MYAQLLPGYRVFDLEASAALDKPQLERIKEYEETVNRLTVSLLMWCVL